MKALLVILSLLITLGAQAAIQFDVVTPSQPYTVKLYGRDGCSSNLCYVYDSEGRRRLDVAPDGSLYRVYSLSGTLLNEVASGQNGGASVSDVRRVAFYIGLLPVAQIANNNSCPVTVSIDGTTFKIVKLQYKCSVTWDYSRSNNG